MRGPRNRLRAAGPAAFLLCLLVAACGEPPRLPALAPDAVVLAFGDSLTFGTGAPPGAGYPEVLATLIGRRVVNAGVPGEETGEGRERLPAELQRHNPDLLLLMHGGNDLLRRRPKQDTEANLRAMVQMARERGVAVAMIAVPKPGLWLEAPELYRDVAEELAVPLEDEIIAEVEGDPALKADPIHPNAAGYRRVAEAVASLLAEAGALAR